MKKYLFTESQLKTLIDNVISEQSAAAEPTGIAIDPKRQPETVLTFYKLKKVKASDVLNYFTNRGVQPESIGEELKTLNERMRMPEVVISLLKELGWDDRSIKKLRLKSAAGTRGFNGVSSVDGGRITVRASSGPPRCSGLGCR